MAGFPREGLLPAPLYIVSEVSNVPSVRPSCHSGNTKENFHILEDVIHIKGSSPIVTDLSQNRCPGCPHCSQAHGYWGSKNTIFFDIRSGSVAGM